MIARHEATVEKMDIWAQLSAPLPTGVIAWRQDGRAIQRDGKYFARFVAYVDANTVRERLDSVVAGEWDLTLELLPTLTSDDQDESTCSFKARLQILGVIREDVGTGRDYKAAATDAFKRAAGLAEVADEPPAATGPLASDAPSCPECGGRMWDDRLSKRSPKAPDFK